LQVTRGILERGAREGVFRAVDPFLAHIGIVGSLVFYYATEPTRRRLVREGRVALPQPAAESFLEHMQEMVLCGLSKWPGARRRGAKEGEGAHEGKGLVAGARRAGGGRRVPGSNG
jgi:hypothetical protein